MRRVALLAKAVLAMGAGGVEAHGPCACLIPARGAPGTSVAVDYPVYKIVFNPDRADLLIGPESLWERHRPGAPITALRRPWRYSATPRDREARFTVPDTGPGRYLIALYDGSEGGAHYSWETFTVTAARPAAGTPTPAVSSDDSGGMAPTVAVGLALLTLLSGVAIGRATRLRGNRPA